MVRPYSDVQNLRYWKRQAEPACVRNAVCDVETLLVELDSLVLSRPIQFVLVRLSFTVLQQPKIRISALERLRSEGINTTALLCPVIPYVSDVMPLIEMLSDYADKLWVYGLSITNRSDQNWQYVDQILESNFPDMRSRINGAVFSRKHAYWERLRNELSNQQKKIKPVLSIHI
jgi:hypothetical protein